MQHNTAWQSSSGTPRHATVTARKDALLPFFTAGCRKQGRVYNMERKWLGGSLAVAQVIRELQAENLRSLSSSRDVERFRAASQHRQWVLTGGITAHPGDRNRLPLAGLMAGSEVPLNTKQRELHKCSIIPRTKTAKRKTERM